MVGLDNLDRVIRIVREAPSNSTASAALKDGKLPMQAFFIYSYWLLSLFGKGIYVMWNTIFVS